MSKNRKYRVHVITVRCIKEIYYLILSDGGKITWNEWINGARDELLK